MKNITKWFKKSMHLSLALLVIAVLGIGLTVAFFTDTEGAINRVTVGKINITTGEDVSGLTKSNIDVTSNGTSEAYVRMRVDIPTVTYTYMKADGTLTDDGRAQIFDVKGVEVTSRWEQLNSLDAIVVRSNGDQEPAKWTKDMLTIVITSEAVQTMDGVSTAQDAFQRVDGGSTN